MLLYWLRVLCAKLLEVLLGVVPVEVGSQAFLGPRMTTSILIKSFDIRIHVHDRFGLPWLLRQYNLILLTFTLSLERPKINFILLGMMHQTLQSLRVTLIDSQIDLVVLSLFQCVRHFYFFVVIVIHIMLW